MKLPIASLGISVCIGAVCIGTAGCSMRDQDARSPDHRPIPAAATLSPENSFDMSPPDVPAAPTATIPAPPLPPGPAEQAAAPARGAMTDEQILEVTHVANAGEIEQAKLAQKKARDPQVKAFAEKMLQHHGDADAKGREVAQRERLTLASSPTSTALDADARQALSTMTAQAGKGFDKAYIDAQVKEHQALLDLVDQKLLTSARAASVKDYLLAIRQTVEMHLKEAQSLQEKVALQ